MTSSARWFRTKRLLRAIVLRLPVLGTRLGERKRLRVQRQALLQDVENLRVAVGQLLTEVHKYRS